MQGYNLIAVFNTAANKMLMCKRRKNPYKGLSNFVGGKIENGETGISAAYRELMEETSLTKEDITLFHLLDFTYYIDDCYLEVYVGKLNKTAKVSGEENELFWIDTDRNFFDTRSYAGDGNIGHIMEVISRSREKLFGEK